MCLLQNKLQHNDCYKLQYYYAKFSLFKFFLPIIMFFFVSFLSQHLLVEVYVFTFKIFSQKLCTFSSGGVSTLSESIRFRVFCGKNKFEIAKYLYLK